MVEINLFVSSRCLTLPRSAKLVISTVWTGEAESERERERASSSSALPRAESQFCAAELPDVSGYQVRAEMSEWPLG